MLKKLLKMLLWLISGSILLLILAIAGFYLYFAIPMQANFAKLDAIASSDCATGGHWQIITPPEDFPPRLREIFRRINQQSMDHVLARQLIEGLHHKQSEFAPRYAVGTLEIKRHYSREKRLELAMNSQYMGSINDCPIYGMSAAARHYFGKTPEQLSVAEMALLVGLAKGANTYNPFKRPERALQRRDYVLQFLRDEHLITEEEYRAALKEPLPTQPHNN